MEESKIIDTKIKNLENKIHQNAPVNNQLINTILEKNKKIEELNNQITNKPNIVIDKKINIIESLTMNNIIITSRSEDNFINATQLCQDGCKLFADGAYMPACSKFSIWSGLIASEVY